MSPPFDAESCIAALGLEPHPEGGYFRSVYRQKPLNEADGDSSSIYFLITADRPSRWHRIRGASEVWYFHAGSPLELAMLVPPGNLVRHVLGIDLLRGERPQAVVPAGAWQRANSLGEWTLVGCSVSPAFDFSAFELAPAGFDPLAD